MMNDEQIERYSRQLIMADFGGSAQEKLAESSVLVVGVGGLGSPAAYYLAAAGVGRLGLVDCDKVEMSNLQRQIIHNTTRVGLPKVQSATETINALNPNVTVEAHHLRADASCIGGLMESYDFLIDGLDQFSGKYLINDACVLNKKPFCHAGALEWSGQVFSYVPGNGCLRCLLPQPPDPGAVPTCAQAGVMGPAVGLLGVIEAMEAIKYLSGVGDLLLNRVLAMNGKTGSFRTLRFAPSATCPVCGPQATIHNLHDEEGPSCEMR